MLTDASAYPSLNQPSYLDLSRVPLPAKVRIGDQDINFSQLTGKQRSVLVDLSRIEKEIADTEFSLQVLRAAKNELSRLLVQISEASINVAESSLSV